MPDSAQGASSMQPYMVRAVHEWCTDNGFTPYLAVRVDKSVQVPQEFVRDGQIVLNASYDATSGLKIDNEWVTFKARFNGAVRELMFPVSRVMAVYARETGQGMAFPEEAAAVDAAVPGAGGQSVGDAPVEGQPGNGSLPSEQSSGLSAASDVGEAGGKGDAPKGPAFKRIK